MANAPIFAKRLNMDKVFVMVNWLQFPNFLYKDKFNLIQVREERTNHVLIISQFQRLKHLIF